MKVKKLRSPADWEKLRNSTKNEKELIIFKYSPFCPTSRYIEHDFKDWCKKINKKDLNIVKVNVIRSRKVSDIIAKEFNIVHESPQLIWLDKQLSVKWNASHYSIDEKELNLKL